MTMLGPKLRIRYQKNGTKIDHNYLIDNQNLRFTKDILGRNKNLKFWFCPKQEEVPVRGGRFGPQLIVTKKWPKSYIKNIMRSMKELSVLTDLKIKKVKNRDKSTHQFFHDEHINLNNGIKYLGLTIRNSRTKNDKGNWEIFLNNFELDSKDQFIYTALHEIGHTLGLEHPHSDSDGDFYRTTSAQNSASPSQTIMSYAIPNWNTYPTQYQANDLNAIIQGWGNSSSNYKLDSIIRQPIVPTLDVNDNIINAKINGKRIIIDGNASPKARIRARIWKETFKDRHVSDQGEWALVIKPSDLTKAKVGSQYNLYIEQLDTSGIITRAEPYIINFI